MTTPDELLLARLVSSAQTPLVTYYDDDTGERIEVSAATFANWVAKTAHLLCDDFGLEPGARVAVDLPPHWQSFIVVHAVWAVGGCVVAGEQSNLDVRVRRSSASAEHDGHAADVLVLALAPLAAPGPVAAGPVTDFDREVLRHADHFPRRRFDVDTAAWTQGPLTLSHAQLGSRAIDQWSQIQAAWPEPAPHRFLLRPRTLDVETMVASTLVPLVAPAGGSIVAVGTDDRQAHSRRLSAERAVNWTEALNPTER